MYDVKVIWPHKDTCIQLDLDKMKSIKSIRHNTMLFPQLVCEGQPTKATRMMQAEEAVSRIKVIIRY